MNTIEEQVLRQLRLSVRHVYLVSLDQSEKPAGFPRTFRKTEEMRESFLKPTFPTLISSSGTCQQRSWAAETASLRKRAVTAPFAFSSELELRHTGRTYLAIVPPRKCVRRLPVIRDAIAASPVKNDVVGISQASDVQDESVWVRCCPSQIAQIVVTEPDHYPVPVRWIICSNTSRNIGSRVSSTWRWFQRPEPRTSGRPEQCPSQPSDGGSRGVRP